MRPDPSLNWTRAVLALPWKRHICMLAQTHGIRHTAQIPIHSQVNQQLKVRPHPGAEGQWGTAHQTSHSRGSVEGELARENPEKDLTVARRTPQHNQHRENAIEPHPPAAIHS